MTSTVSQNEICENLIFISNLMCNIGATFIANNKKNFIRWKESFTWLIFISGYVFLFRTKQKTNFYSFHFIQFLFVNKPVYSSYVDTRMRYCIFAMLKVYTECMSDFFKHARGLNSWKEVFNFLEKFFFFLKKSKCIETDYILSRKSKTAHKIWKQDFCKRGISKCGN